jgi:hypothetical protein
MESLSVTDIFQRLVLMERELAELRQALLTIHGVELAKRQPGSLRGVWRGAVIEEEDFAAAKASLFPERDP